MSERRHKALRRQRREAMAGTGGPGPEAPGDAARAREAAANMAAARERNAQAVREEFGGKVADAAMAMGRAERRQYLRDVRRVSRGNGGGRR